MYPNFNRGGRLVRLSGLLVLGLLFIVACQPVVIDTAPTPTEPATTPAAPQVTPTPTSPVETPTSTTPLMTPTEMPPTPSPTEPPPIPTPTVVAEPIRVTVRDSAFDPPELTVTVGTTVIWTHQGFLPHTVTADDGSFDGGPLNRGQTFEFSFTEARTYAYHCEFHGGSGGFGMSGTIIVTEG